ncbi:protein jagunal isoform X2 [Euwallacea fornicatus]|uniref:protein jagunal isoform X2 n=1 Tax=Euwallacea fornicatus TaxID=995702 RepID=UPI00338F3C2D
MSMKCQQIELAWNARMEEIMLLGKEFQHTISSVMYPNGCSALTKTRLKYCIFFHYILSFAMLAKLTPYILDRFNIFILPIEELEVPEPLWWEWFWLSSILSSILALDAMKKNHYIRMRYYMTGIVLLGYLPLLNGLLKWFPEVVMYLYAEKYTDFDDIFFWMGLPYGLLWYGFIFLAGQVHSFSLYFGYKLLCAWRLRGTHRD